MENRKPINMGREEIMEMMGDGLSPIRGTDALFRKTGGSGTGKAEHWYKDGGRVVKAFMIRATYQGRGQAIGKVKLVPQRRYDMFVTQSSSSSREHNAAVDLWILCGSKFARIPYSVYGLKEVWPEVYRVIEDVVE